MALLEVSNLGIAFGGLQAVAQLDLSIEKGHLYGLIGPNGAGKTTVFNMLTGVYKPTEGNIILDGKDITGQNPELISKSGIARPCPTQADGWSEAQRSRYREILRRCDYETMVQQSYTPGCMQRRNRYMVDHASLLIAVNDGLRGGTRSTIEYAFRRGVSVLDIPLE